VVRPRVARTAAALLAGAFLLAGCGIPRETGVVVDGPVAERDAEGDGTGADTPYPPGAAKTDEELVRYFLQAAAGDVSSAPDRLRKFLLRPDTWQPGTTITVVRLGRIRTVQPVGQTGQVEVPMQPVGRLTPSGYVVPVIEPEITHTFRVVSREPTEAQRYIENPPSNVMYLDSAALTDWYIPVSIYFWDTTGNHLVPDLRYLPKSVPLPARPTQIVRWVLDGPSEWLQPAVQPLPDGIDLRDNAVKDGDRLVVNLSAKAAEVKDPERLLIQLGWSLRDTYRGPMVLQIERQPKVEGATDANLSANRAAVLGEPIAYCVVAGTIMRGRGEECLPGTDLPAGLAPDLNRKVQSAAITRDGRRAAVVQAVGNGRAQVVASEIDSATGRTERSTVGTFDGPVGRPVWLAFPGESAERGLIPIRGELHEFQAGSEGTSRVDIQGRSELRDITAVAVAPDGRRIAIAAGGHVYVATVGIVAGKVSLGPPRRLVSSISGIVGVGWSRQDRIVVGGKSGDSAAIAELSVDGGIEEMFRSGLDPLEITSLVAFPNSPAQPSPGLVKIQANGTAWNVYVTTYRSLKIAEPATPSPGASPVPVDPSATVTASFFAD